MVLCDLRSAAVAAGAGLAVALALAAVLERRAGTTLAAGGRARLVGRGAALAAFARGRGAELLVPELLEVGFELLLGALVVVQHLRGAAAIADAPVDEPLPHVELAELGVGGVEVRATLDGPVEPLTVELLTVHDAALEERFPHLLRVDVLAAGDVVHQHERRRAALDSGLERCCIR